MKYVTGACILGIHHACAYQSETLLMVDSLPSEVYIRLARRYQGLSNTLVLPKGIEKMNTEIKIDIFKKSLILIFTTDYSVIGSLHSS